MAMRDLRWEVSLLGGHALQFGFEQGDFRVGPAGKPCAVGEEPVDHAGSLGIAVVCQGIENRGDLRCFPAAFEAR